MKKTKKIVILCMIMLCSLNMIFANGGQELAKAEGPVTITYYTWDDACHKALVDTFNKSQNEIFVDAKILAYADYEAKLTTLLSGQAEMDCFMEKRYRDVFTQFALCCLITILQLL